MTEDQSRLGSVRANRGIDRRKFMKSLGAIGISGAGLNTAIGKARATPSRDRVRIVTHRSKENLFGLNRFQKNGLNRKSEHVEDSSYSRYNPERVERVLPERHKIVTFCII